MATEDFQKRLGRIAERQEATHSAQAGRLPKSRAMGKGSRGRYTLSLFGALASGFLTVVLVRYVRFHLTGAGEVSDVTAFLMDAGISIVACIAIKEMFKLNEPEFKAAQGIGVFVMVMMMHNLAFWAPKVMATAFSPAWVQQQRQDTIPNSLWVVVQYIPLLPQATQPQEPERPAVVYRN